MSRASSAPRRSRFSATITGLSEAGPDTGALRFVAIALGAFLVSMALLEALERLTAWRAATSLFVSVLVILISSYVLNPVFVFRAPGTGRAP